MPQTFYIENDEEIISVIGRLRRSSSEENYFVFPKRALVLQSIVNLRLFQREAEKLGKRIVIVTQDDAGKALAEKAGLLTERYTDDFSRQSEHIELVSAAVPSHPPREPELPPVSHGGLRSQDVGSSDFYGGSSSLPLPSHSPLPTDAAARTLRVRNAAPEKQTSLNSMRDREYPGSRPMIPVRTQSQEALPRSAEPTRPPLTRPGKQAVLPERREVLQGGREQRLRNFFSNGGVSQNIEVAPVAKPNVSPKVPIAPHKAGGILLVLGGISALSLLGVAIFLFLPKAEIHVVPYRTVQDVDLQFDGKTTPDTSSEKNILVRMFERQEEVTLSLEATGSSLGAAQKARGTVVISNTFSTEAQSLVATTRFESPEGKIFRLAEGVTVPGMSNGQAGAVEATVIADQAGTEFNIAATTFTIPGFKGSPKFEKFSAKSSKAMSGGSSSSGGGQKVIAKNDLDKATEAAREQARERSLESIKGELLPGERLLEENLDIVSLNDAGLPLAGTAGSSFEYKNTFKIRGFVFSEETLKQRILSSGEETVGGVKFQPVSVVLTYGESIPDFEAEAVRLKVHASVVSESVIAREAFLQAVLGQNESGIDAALVSFPEIKKIEVIFKPQWFAASVPDSESRVTLFIEPGEGD